MPTLAPLTLRPLRVYLDQRNESERSGRHDSEHGISFGPSVQNASLVREVPLNTVVKYTGQRKLGLDLSRG